LTKKKEKSSKSAKPKVKKATSAAAESAGKTSRKTPAAVARSVKTTERAAPKSDKPSGKAKRAQLAQKSLTRHYNTTQLRQDTWNRLRMAATALYDRSKRSGDKTEPIKAIKECFALLEPIERFWAFPGKSQVDQLRSIFESKDYFLLVRALNYVVRAIVSESFRESLAPHNFPIEDLLKGKSPRHESKSSAASVSRYFEVLVVDFLEPPDEIALKKRMRSQQDKDSEFLYDIVVAPSFEDALLAVVLNPTIQSCVIRYGFPVKSRLPADLLRPYFSELEELDVVGQVGVARGLALAKFLKKLRPELDLFLVTDASVEEAAAEGCRYFRRIFYRHEDYLELHLSICKGIRERFTTPFFHALVEYSKQPTGVFHAMPVSRGNSVFKTHWIRDMGEFYGKNIFLAETSATTGGLDSLLHPTGPIKLAQEYAARAFGSLYTYFVTNGTSTANKIVQQALLKPGDIVLIDRDCHKSHHYGITLAGAYPVYLDSYPLTQYSMYGAVPLHEIKRILTQFKREGRLDKIKMVVLTNSTFDGLIYNPRRVMREILAIKPDMIFLWDEAWFGFAHFHHMYRQRAGMASAKHLARTLRSDEYREQYREHLENVGDGDPFDPDKPWLPDPDKVRIRAYATHSTHKTLSSLRQGSMIHIYDESFHTKSERVFNEAYMTHTSTSPNYQILASLDVARRQAELEGFELVQKSIEMAMIFRETIKTNKVLSRYFSCLTPGDLIPDQHRPSGFAQFYDPDSGWASGERAWHIDEFVLDPTRITLYIGKTGIDGDTFRKKYLMDKFGVQVNKTSRNTVLFMTNIGATRSATAYLIGVLIKIAKQLRKLHFDMTAQREAALARRIRSLTEELPPLPDFSEFHPFFRPNPATPEGDLRTAFYLAYDSDNCAYAPLSHELAEAVGQGRTLVSASFVTPYPPGFPVLAPGQIITRETLDFLLALEVKEIHGYNPELGLRVFKDEALRSENDAPEKKRVAKTTSRRPSSRGEAARPASETPN